MRSSWIWTRFVLFAVALMYPSLASAQLASRRPAPVAIAMQKQKQPTPKTETEAKPEPKTEDEELVVKVYRISDLIVSAPNYPYEGTFLPGTSKTMPGANHSSPAGGMGGIGMGGMGGAGMGGMGGMGGGMGGMMGSTGAGTVRADHLAQVGGAATPAQPQGGGLVGGGAARGNISPRPPAPRITFGMLVNAITSVIDADSWDVNGGEGSIEPVGGSMAVSNTAAIQAKLAKFLEALRAENDALRTITIDAQWLSLDDEQLAKLRGATGEKSAAGAGVSRKALAALPAETRRASGQISCLNGQTTHVISGLMRTKVQGTSPSVGGDAVGYQPIITTPHLGTLLQTTASLLPGEESALVDLHSIVTRWDEEAEPVRFGNGNPGADPVAQVDRLIVSAQQLATSLRAPLGKPILVGGMTNSALPNTGAADSVDRLYLVIEVTAPTEK